MTGGFEIIAPLKDFLKESGSTRRSLFMIYSTRLSAVQLIAFLAIPLATSPGSAPQSAPDFSGTLSGIPSGSNGNSGPPVPIALPLRKTDEQLSVSAGLIEGEVAQVFTNNTGTTLEAIYVFPLPSEATVTGMELRVGERVIKSVVKEREQARQQYEAARAQGQKTGLLEQERPNIFTTSVANFNPGETVRIR